MTVKILLYSLYLFTVGLHFCLTLGIKMGNVVNSALLCIFSVPRSLLKALKI